MPKFKVMVADETGQTLYDEWIEALGPMEACGQAIADAKTAEVAETEEQAVQARRKIAELNASGTFRKPIATVVETGRTFWKAEEYHQRYLEKRGMTSCHI